MEASPPYSDPVLTANLYCAGRLDEVLHQVIAPSWGVIRQLEPDSGAYLWLLRSAQGGEHLKVRLHGPGLLIHPARAHLQQAAQAFFAQGESPPPAWTASVANDLEDETASGPSDRSLVWTRYRRSPAELGGEPFLDDDGYVGRITRCLAVGCERVLRLKPDATGKIPRRVRQTALLEGLAAGLGAPGFPADTRPAYLAYHRDSLLRLPLARDSTEACKSEELLRLFDREIEAMGVAANVLRRAVRSEWVRDPGESWGADADWRRALANLLWYIRPLCDDPEYRIDPSAANPCFIPVFQVLHGLANQLGLSRAEEAFAHHLLGSVMDGEGSRSPVPAGAWTDSWPD